MICAAYQRFSPDEQASEGDSIAVQKEAIERYLKTKGDQLDRHYTDTGFSGAWMERPELQALLEDARAGKFPGVRRAQAVTETCRNLFNTAIGMSAAERQECLKQIGSTEDRASAHDEDGSKRERAQDHASSARTSCGNNRIRKHRGPERVDVLDRVLTRGAVMRGAYVAGGEEIGPVGVNSIV